MKKLTINFARAEFACKCGCGFDTVDYQLLEGLQRYANHLKVLSGGKVSVIINSGCRCAKYNSRINGAKNSQHLKGRAADIRVQVNGVPIHPEDVAKWFHANEPDFSTGIYPSFTHVDTRSGTPWRGVNAG